MTLVAAPLGRGSVCSSKDGVSAELTSTLASHADVASHCERGMGERSPRGPGRSVCGWTGVLPGAYVPMRPKICLNSSASWADAKTRCSVWQLTQLVMLALRLSGPGALISHSALESWFAKFFVLTSLMSALAPTPAISTAVGPSRL